MNYHETPVIFKCDNSRLVGIATVTDTPLSTGVLILVGGPQYRSGSHRQFTLLARHLAERGIPSFRFDYRGMGDSEGDTRVFEKVDADIQAAIDTFRTTAENIQKIVIWGLCDAASAALFYAHTDPRVCGLVLLNPWVHSEEGASRARLKHYYLSRILQKSFWSKLLSAQVRFVASGVEILEAIKNKFMHNSFCHKSSYSASTNEDKSYIDRMLAGLIHFSGNILFILSGNDLVAQQFNDLTLVDKGWREAMKSSRFDKVILEDANHTFSSRAWRDQVNKATLQWINKCQ